MPRYIDADALLNKVERYFSGLPIVVHHDMVEYIENAPTADVVERKRGRLLNAEPVGECSICGWLMDYRDGFNYCPNCGAEMEEEDAEIHQG